MTVYEEILELTDGRPSQIEWVSVCGVGAFTDSFLDAAKRTGERVMDYIVIKLKDGRFYQRFADDGWHSVAPVGKPDYFDFVDSISYC